MSSDYRSAVAPRPSFRVCAAGCGRRATVVSAGREFCALCYGQRRARAAAKSGGARL